MRIFRDFKCPNGHVTEHFLSNDIEVTRCDCGEEAKKVISPVKSVLDPISGGFAGATMKWAKDRERKIQQERKANSQQPFYKTNLHNAKARGLIMAAKLIDERPEEDNVDTAELETQEQFEPQQEVTQEPENELPDKYKGKSAAELARMHQEAEKLLGRQSSEVGELRKVVDSYIQTQLSQQYAPQQPEQDDDVDFFTDPERAVSRAIEKHPKIREAELYSQQYKKVTALGQLQAKHPDMNNILNDDKFAEWVKGSKIRTQLFVQADQQYDYEAADELFSLWKDRQTTVQQTAQAEKAGRKEAVRSANTGNARGNPDSQSRKIYRRADIIKLMKTDPDRYQSLSDEIMKAYAEGRVKQLSFRRI